jgi:hypothetical protein
MKKTLFLFTGFLLMVIASFAQAGNTPAIPGLAGDVTDSATGKPLAGCSVYLNSTSIGTVTGADGSFLLRKADGGFYPANGLLASGRWAKTEKICNLLPFNYQLPEQIPIIELNSR